VIGYLETELRILGIPIPTDPDLELARDVLNGLLRADTPDRVGNESELACDP
jgi:hypothetical protein